MRSRPLVMEHLEQRVLLAGDVPAWQNPVLAEDVDGDSVVAPNDVLLIANELYKTGSRPLYAEPQVAATGFAAAGAEGEDARLFLDVNGDNYISPADALRVVTRLIAEGQTDVVQLRFDITDPTGTSIQSVDVGDSFALNVFVQDIQPPSPDSGVFAAFLDVFYDAPEVSISGEITFGPDYSFYPSDDSDKSTPGEIRNVGQPQTYWNAPLGPSEFLLFTVPFTADAAPMDAEDDAANTDANLNVAEDSPGVLLDLLANDTLGGSTGFSGAPAGNPPATDVLIWSDPGPAVPPEDIIYGSDTLEINSPGSLLITGVGLPSDGGTAAIVSGGMRVEYTPPATANALGAGETATDYFTYTISDGFGSDLGEVTVTLVGENDAPTAQDIGFGTSESVPIGGSLAAAASDPDTNDSLTFSGGASSALGAAITVGSEGTFTYDPNASGTLNALAVGESVDDTFTYTVDDENGGTATATVTVNVVGLNDPPAAEDDSGAGFATDEDTGFVTGDVLANDTDPDGDTLSIIALDANLTLGDVTDNGDGTFTYDPNGQFDWLPAGQSAQDVFSYTISDGFDGTDTATVTIAIDGVNDPPVANDDSGLGFAVDQDGTLVTGNVLDNDTDAEGDAISLTDLNTSGTFGEVTDNGDGTFGYDPNGQFDFLGAGQNATDFFGYTIGDGNGGTDTAGVAITVSGQNDSPTAQDGSFGTDEDTPINGTLTGLANDPDVDDTLEFSNGAPSALGAAVTIDSDGTFSYDPTGSSTLRAMLPGETLVDTFSFTVTDGTLSDSAQVTITVSGRNDSPIALDDDLFVDEQSADNVLDVLGNDSDADATDTLAVVSVGPTDQGGTATAALDGSSIDYTPDPGFIGQETFTYTIEDGEGATATATVVVDVEALTMPRARNDAYTVAEDSQDNDLDVFANDLVNAGGTPIISITGAPDEGGSVVITGPTTLEYTPDANFFGTETFRYTLDDGIGVPEEAVVTVTVTGENDAPDAVDDPFTTDQDTPFVTTDVLANDTDVDGDLLSLTGIDTTGTVGQVTDNGDGTFGYDPNGQFDSLPAGQSTTDSFAYTISDGNGETDTATVTITIDGLNDAPVANDDSDSGFTTDQDAAFVTANVLTNDTDAEGDLLSVDGIDTTGTLGSVTDRHDGTFDYDPNGQFDFLGPGVPAEDIFTYTVSDGNGGTDVGEVRITVVGLNNSPVANDDSGVGFTTDEDTAFTTSSVLANDTDLDGGVLSVDGIDTTGMAGQVTDNGDGTFTYDPDGQFEALGAGDSPTVSFTYTLGDGQGGFDTATVTVTINGVNDAPVASDDSGPDFTTDQNSAFVTGDVTTNDTDAENAPLSIVSIDTTGTLGQVTDNADGTFAYDPNGQFTFVGLGQTATDTFTYTISDSNGGSDTATVNVAVTGLNDLPTAQDASFGTDEDTLLDGSLATWANDPDSNDTLTFSGPVSSTQGAQVTLNADGTFSYDPTVSSTLQALLPGDSLADTFDYTVTDDSGDTAGATVTIDVAGVNDAPTAVDDSYSGILEDSSDNVLDVLDDDFTDPESGETLTITSVGPTSAGGVVINDGSQLRYTPGLNFFGTETFSYTISDGNGGSDTAVVSVAVDPQNDPPTANDNRYDFISNTGPHILNVLGNDTTVPDAGESLTIVSTTTPDRGGTIVNEGGRLLYTPPAGVQGAITETFTYTIDDGNGGTDTATVAVDVIGFFPSSLSGNVFVDANRNGALGAGEEGIGDVNVTLTGVDMFGTAVSRSTATSGDGSYSFGNLVPGDYRIRSEQPAFMLDGAERVGTQGGSRPANDQLSVSIASPGGVIGRNNNFAELGLQPQCIGVWDFLNTSSGEGVLFATDGTSGQLWFSFLDGWDGFTSATARVSANGSTLNVTFVDQASNTSTIRVPFAESAVLHFRASAGTRHLVQLVGSPSDFGLAAAASGAEGEGLSGLPEVETLGSPIMRPLYSEPAPAAGLSPHAAPATSAGLTSSTILSAQEPVSAAVEAEGEFLEATDGLAGAQSGLWYGLLSTRSLDLPPATMSLPGLSAADLGVKDEADPTAGPNDSGVPAEDRLLAVDAVFGSADDGDSWEPLSDEFFEQYEDNLSIMTQGLLTLPDDLPTWPPHS